MPLDTALFQLINGTAQSPHWLLTLAVFSTVHLPTLVAGGLVGAFATGSPRVRRAALQTVAAIAMAWVAARLIQHVVPVDRPFTLGLGMQWLPHKASPSFPSNHATAAFAFAGAVAFATRRWMWALPALLLAGLISWSRVYLGLHFPSDVLAGAVIGTGCGWLAVWLSSRKQGSSKLHAKP